MRMENKRKIYCHLVAELVVHNIVPPQTPAAAQIVQSRSVQPSWYTCTYPYSLIIILSAALCAVFARPAASYILPVYSSIYIPQRAHCNGLLLTRVM